MTLNTKIPFTLFVLATLILSACTSLTGLNPQPGPSQPPGAETPATTAQPGDNPLVNTHWTLVSFGGADNQVNPVIASSTVTLQFEPEGRAGGSGGCNSYGAAYQVQGNQVSFSEIISTMMACADPSVNEQEQRYFQALQSAGAFKLDGDQLKIWYGDGQSVLNFVQSQAATPNPTATTSPASTPTQPGEQATPTPQRIEFGSGDISTVVSGLLPASGSDLYVLSAAEGQIMTVALSFTQGRAILAIWGADGAVLMSDHAEATHFSGALPATQDYYILVAGSPEGETYYKMQVIIPQIASSAQTLQRIEFASGGTSATESGHLAASGSKLYVIAAEGGQTMTFDLSYTQGWAIMVVWGADGTVLMSDHAEAASFSRTLPTPQDYYILVKGSRNNETDYSLQVTIPPLS